MPETVNPDDLRAHLRKLEQWARTAAPADAALMQQRAVIVAARYRQLTGARR